MRYVCLKNAEFIDEPNLIDVSYKRPRESEPENDESAAKGQKLSNSPPGIVADEDLMDGKNMDLLQLQIFQPGGTVLESATKF